MMKMLVVDGNSVINRAFYGIHSLSTKSGFPTNAIYGFLTILLSMTDENEPDKTVITFDKKAPTFRHKLYAEYKGQRKGMPEELAVQMPKLKEILTYLGFPIVELEGYEADDLLGTLSKACSDQGGVCIIATGDRDSFQLINENVMVRMAYTKAGKSAMQLVNLQTINEVYGILPEQLIDVKALMGDTSDNIPGVAGIGEKTAIELIKKFGSLDKLYANLDSEDIRPRVKEKLEAGRETAYLSRKLGTIDRNAPIDTNMDSYLTMPTDDENACKVLTELELFSIMDKFGIAANNSSKTQQAEDAGTMSLFLNQLSDDMLKAGSMDVLFHIANDTVAAFCVILPDALHLITENVEQLAVLVLSSPARKRTNQVKELCKYALKRGFEIQNVTFDLEIAAYILNPTASDYSVQKLATEYNIPVPAVDIHDNKALEPFLFDCRAFFPLANMLEGQIAENEQGYLFNDVELPLAAALADMEFTGIPLNTEGLKAYGHELREELDRLTQTIYTLAGEEFNINSPQQLGTILFEKLNLPAGKKTKTGYSTNIDVLEALQDKHEIVGHILAYRSIAKLISTYVDGLMKNVQADGRIHTSFQQTLTRTGRISSIEPNMQNIPIRTAQGSKLRKFFYAGEGHVLLDADYSQIELRVLAHMADDKNMVDAFVSDVDIHTKTASQVFNVAEEEVTHLLRTRAKAVNFGIVYGIGASSLSKDIGVTKKEAGQYIDNYLNNFDGVRDYLERTISMAQEKGYVETIMHRRRYLPELHSTNRMTLEFGKRVARNTPIQGTAADIIKIAMVRVWSRLKMEKLEARLVLQVHDELLVDCPEQEEERVREIMLQEMEYAISMKVPLKVDIEKGVNWLETKGL